MPPTWLIWFACVWALLTFTLAVLFAALLLWARAKAPSLDDWQSTAESDGLKLLGALDDQPKEEQEHIERSHG
jgi:hypothetical protein